MKQLPDDFECLEVSVFEEWSTDLLRRQAIGHDGHHIDVLLEFGVSEFFSNSILDVILVKVEHIIGGAPLRVDMQL